MKDSILYITTIVLFLSLSLSTYINPAYAQDKKLETKTQQPETSTQFQQKQCSSKQNNSFSLDFSLKYDFLSKFEKIDSHQDSANTNDISTSKKSANYIELHLSFNTLTKHTKFTILGIDFILPHDFDNKLTINPGTGKEVRIEQKLLFGISLNLFKFGYRFNIASMELIPYLGVSVLYLRSQVYADINDDNHSVSFPIYTGLDVIFTNLGSLDFFAGLEFGISPELKHVGNHTSPLYPSPRTGNQGKLSVGTSYKF